MGPLADGSIRRERHIWKMSDIVDVLEAWEAKAA
jgi:hypothetical protein